MQSLLSLEAVSIVRGSALLAGGVACTVAAGGILLLTGPNGSGKTSALRVMAGLLQPATGAITRNGDFHFLSAQAIKPSLETPAQYLKFQASLMGKNFLSHDPFGITPYLGRPLNQLSTGWRQRVKLSRLLLHNRPIWFLDEPGDGLDEPGKKILNKLIADHIRSGGAAVIATHDPHLWPDAQRIAFGATS